jgi:RpiB/LacA/LacB family sugar-phosphate isomerase
MKIFLASDHGGFQLKEFLKKFLTAKNFPLEDLGCHNEGSCDYPDFAHALAEKILEYPDSKGLAVCGTGIGISIALNRHPHIRAARCTSVYDAEMARRHNDANVLVLGGRITDHETASAITAVFLATEFEGGRHAKRIEKLKKHSGSKLIKP